MELIPKWPEVTLRGNNPRERPPAVCAADDRAAAVVRVANDAAAKFPG